MDEEKPIALILMTKLLSPETDAMASVYGKEVLDMCLQEVGFVLAQRTN